jgi:hypothetical protein
MQIVPVQAVPNQTISILLANQSCQITLSTRFFGLYMDLSVSNTPVRAGVVCQDRNRLIRYQYLGFLGDFWFLDTQGTSDPVYTGIGSRYLLQYIAQADLATVGLLG